MSAAHSLNKAKTVEGLPVEADGLDVVPRTPLDVLVQNMNANAPSGMVCSVKRRCADGSLIDVSANQLSTLTTKSRVATAAQALKELSPKERTEWAIENKDYANELYANNLITEAMEKYVEALAATDFGKGENIHGDASSEEENNVDILVIPILSNLAACCIQKKEFSKALQFTDQALKLRPNCGKALMRRGMAHLHFGEFKKAALDLNRALEITSESHKDAVLVVNEADRQRIPILLHKVQQGMESEAKAVAKQKRSLEKHFKRRASEGAADAPPPTASAPPSSVSSAFAVYYRWWLDFFFRGFLDLFLLARRKRE